MDEEFTVEPRKVKEKFEALRLFRPKSEGKIPSPNPSRFDGDPKTEKR